MRVVFVKFNFSPSTVNTHNAIYKIIKICIHIWKTQYYSSESSENVLAHYNIRRFGSCWIGPFLRVTRCKRWQLRRDYRFCRAKSHYLSNSAGLHFSVCRESLKVKDLWVDESSSHNISPCLMGPANLYTIIVQWAQTYKLSNFIRNIKKYVYDSSQNIKPYSKYLYASLLF